MNSDEAEAEDRDHIAKAGYRGRRVTHAWDSDEDGAKDKERYAKAGYRRRRAHASNQDEAGAAGQVTLSGGGLQGDGASITCCKSGRNHGGGPGLLRKGGLSEARVLHAPSPDEA